LKKKKKKKKKGFARISTWKWGGINVNTPDKKEVSFS